MPTFKTIKYSVFYSRVDQIKTNIGLVKNKAVKKSNGIFCFDGYNSNIIQKNLWKVTLNIVCH